MSVAATPNRNENTSGQVAHPEAPLATNGLVAYRAESPEDILKIRDTVLEAHAEGRYSHLPFSGEKFERAYTKAIRHPADTLSVYVQHNGVTVGILNAGVGDYYLGIGGRMVTVYALYVSGKVRNSLLGGRVGIKLMRMATDWSKLQKAEEIQIHSTSGIDAERTDRLLSRLGFKAIGGNYVARI
ncbi:hypothetical protein [Maritalea sp.]|uniref:hypothetical protein n=1 Tax=Maritalea sp. TaxID=2003361 RepID=UPI003EF61012